MIRTHHLKVKHLRRRRARVKKKFDRFDGKPRLVVIRSARHITGQLIDDEKGITLVSASSLEKEVKADLKKDSSKVETAGRIGEILGKRAVEQKIENIVFDRNGYLYHGRVKAFADGARKSGLIF